MCVPQMTNRNMYCSITCSSSQLEISQMAISNSMDKYIVVNVHNFHDSNVSPGHHHLPLGALLQPLNLSSCLIFALYSSFP